MKLPKGVTNYRNEEWKDLKLGNVSAKHKYKISNYGRIISYYYHDEGRLRSLGNVNGYKSFSVRDLTGKNMYLYAHRLVAEHFLEDPNPDQTVIIHLDNNRHNNYYRNLMWASERERFFFHMKKSPQVWKKFKPKGARAWSKLSESDVKLIKRKLFDPKRKTKMKILARQFGVSEMQLYRIKSGENWSSVKPD